MPKKVAWENMNEMTVIKNRYRRINVLEERKHFSEKIKVRISLMRLAGYLISHTLFFINKLKWKKPAHPEEVIWVDPNQIVRSIEFSNIVRQRRYYLNGIIKDGNWDKGTYTVYHLHNGLFKAFEKRFIEGLSYLETNYFKEKNLPKPRLRALADKYERKYDNIYSDIARDGFSVPSSVFDQRDAFKVSITAEGEFLFMTGKHRLAITKLMGDEFKMPVKVSHRHTEWQKYRDKLYSELRAGKIKKKDIIKLNHPDLLDLVENG